MKQCENFHSSVCIMYKSSDLDIINMYNIILKMVNFLICYKEAEDVFEKYSNLLFCSFTLFVCQQACAVICLLT